MLTFGNRALESFFFFFYQFPVALFPQSREYANTKTEGKKDGMLNLPEALVLASCIPLVQRLGLRERPGVDRGLRTNWTHGFRMTLTCWFPEAQLQVQLSVPTLWDCISVALQTLSKSCQEAWNRAESSKKMLMSSGTQMWRG